MILCYGVDQPSLQCIAAMAERLDSLFPPTSYPVLDDETLAAVFACVNPTQQLSGSTNNAATSTSMHVSLPPSSDSIQVPHETQHASRLSLPEAFKKTDLAELNAFLLQVGSGAARDNLTGVAGGDSTSASASMSSAFDAATLSQLGLTNIPGFDESMLTTPLLTPSSWSTGQDASMLNNMQPGPDRLYPTLDAGRQSAFHTQQQMSAAQRPIAQLPSRQQHHAIPFMQTGYHANATQDFTQQQTTSGFSSMCAATSAPMYPAMSAPSFDTMRSSRGQVLVPQLAPMEVGNHNFRRIEALTRAAPSVMERVSDVTGPRAKPSSITCDDGMDETDDRHSKGRSSSAGLAPLQTVEDRQQSVGSTNPSLPPISCITGVSDADQYRQRSLSPSSSSESSAHSTVDTYDSPDTPTLGLYPKITQGDPSRRLPTPAGMLGGHQRVQSGPSISSILESRPFSVHRYSQYDAYRSEAGSPPPTAVSNVSRDSTESVDSSSPSIYPSLSPGRFTRLDSADGIADDVANLGGLGRNLGTTEVPEEVRMRHIQLIRHLLVSFNDYWRRQQASYRTMRPSDEDEMERSDDKTPPSTYRSAVPLGGPQREAEQIAESSARASTPTPKQQHERLPTISHLIGEVTRPRPNELRKMDVDV